MQIFYLLQYIPETTVSQETGASHQQDADCQQRSGRTSVVMDKINPLKKG
jgi:hypothetical protein